MKSIALLFLLLLLFPTNRAFGQAKPIKRIIPVELKNPDATPRLKDYAFVITVMADGSASIKVQASEHNESLSTGQVKGFFDRELALKTIRSSDSLKSTEPIIIVKPEPTVRFSTIKQLVEPLRRTGENRIKIELQPENYLIVPARQRANQNVKPNPLFLVINVSADSSIDLNNEPLGNLSNRNQITERLKRIFTSRGNNGVFREGTDLIETSVYVKVPDDLEFRDLVKVTSAIRSAGSDQIFLAVDDLPDFIVTERKELIKINP